MSKGLSTFNYVIPLSVLNMSLYVVIRWWPMLLEHLKDTSDISYGVTVKMLELVDSWNSGVSGDPCIVWSLSVAGAEGILLKVSLNRPFVELISFWVSLLRRNSGFVGDFYSVFIIGGTARLELSSLLWWNPLFKFIVANFGSKSITVTGLYYFFFTDLGISKCLFFKICPELNWRNFWSFFSKSLQMPSLEVTGGLLQLARFWIAVDIL